MEYNIDFIGIERTVSLKADNVIVSNLGRKISLDIENVKYDIIINVNSVSVVKTLIANDVNFVKGKLDLPFRQYLSIEDRVDENNIISFVISDEGFRLLTVKSM